MSYKGYRGCHMILVFDAYKVPQNKGKSQMYHDMEIVYKKKDRQPMLILKASQNRWQDNIVLWFATSDNLEQKIVLGHGATRISSRELLRMSFLVLKFKKKNLKEKILRCIVMHLRISRSLRTFFI